MSRQLDFRDHRRSLDDNRFVYAVVSRRSRGLSIGLNLNPDKACNFDCPYCQVDRTTPGRARAVDLAVLSDELERLLELERSGQLWSVPPFDTAAPALRRLNDLAFAGDGEPTAAACFADAVDAVGALRARFGYEQVKLILLTNATLFHRPAVQRGLESLGALGGEIWAKLDAGTEGWFHKVDGTKLPFQRVLDNLSFAAKRWPLTLQCMFIRMNDQGPSDHEVAAWAGRIADILAAGGQIRQVQVYAIARAPADPAVGLVPVSRLEEIAAAAAALGVDVAVYPGLAPEPATS